MLLRKTSFEALLDSFDADAPAHWPLKGKSLPYGRLQWEMEQALGCTIYDDDSIISNSSAAARQPDARHFFASLTVEVRRVDGHFREAVVRVVKLNGWRMRMKLGALRALMCRSAEEHERARLAQEVQWCQQFAAMNRIGLQRLLEQYDRCCPAGGGARFMQACWDPETDIGLFLKTPLLDELKRLKKLLMVAVSDAAALAALSPGGRTGKLACSSMSVPKSVPAWNGSALALQQHGSSGPIPGCPPQQLPRSMLAA